MPAVRSIQTVPDARGVQVNVHYSISELPKVGCQRLQADGLADDRIGYFLTVMKDFSRECGRRTFRPLHQPLESSETGLDLSDLSPPKEPIVFYVEKTVPVALRPTS